ncbi:MAG: hypothetical protein WCF57_05140 [Pyrinomonadaceae bacterium]
MIDPAPSLTPDSSMRRANLFYKSTCPPCRWMSRLAVILSFGIIRRTPVSSAEAKALYQQYPEHDGQLILTYPHGVAFGRMVFAAVPLVVLKGGWDIITRSPARLGLPNGTSAARRGTHDEGGQR